MQSLEFTSELKDGWGEPVKVKASPSVHFEGRLNLSIEDYTDSIDVHLSKEDALMLGGYLLKFAKG